MVSVEPFQGQVTLFVDVTFDDTAGTNQWCLKDEKTFYSDGLHY